MTYKITDCLQKQMGGGQSPFGHPVIGVRDRGWGAGRIKVSQISVNRTEIRLKSDNFLKQCFFIGQPSQIFSPPTHMHPVDSIMRANEL